MDGWTGWMDWILLRSLVQLEHLAVLKIDHRYGVQQDVIFKLPKSFGTAQASGAKHDFKIIWRGELWSRAANLTGGIGLAF